MDWRDQGFVLAARRHGESDAILTVLTREHGRHLGIVKGGHVDDFMVALNDTRNALANSAGFRITTVAINGRKQLSQDEVLAVGGVNGRS